MPFPSEEKFELKCGMLALSVIDLRQPHSLSLPQPGLFSRDPANPIVFLCVVLAMILCFGIEFKNPDLGEVQGKIITASIQIYTD